MKPRDYIIGTTTNFAKNFYKDNKTGSVKNSSLVY